MPHILHLEPRQFDCCRHSAVHKRTDRREIVQRYERIHLELVRRQQSLHHDEPNGLEHDSADLKQHADDDEIDFAETGDHNA